MMEQERPEQPEDEFFVHDDTHEQAPQEAEGDDLDGMRIRQIAARRRSAYRSRSYCIVAAVGMIVAAGQLGYLAVREIRGDGWGALAVGYLLFAVLCPMVAVRFWRKARE